jgi:glycerate 2-kinase
MLTDMPVADARTFLESLFHDTVAALHPAGAVRQALDQRAAMGAPEAPVHLIGLGKAAPAMCAAALQWHAERQRSVSGGICVSHDPGGVSIAPLPLVLGDHPVPGIRSHQAATALGAFIDARVRPGDAVIVLLSGGTSALIGAPREGMSTEEYDRTVAALIASGLSITAINRERRKLSRWGGGQLGLALTARGATVEVFAISDVPGDDPASIGSGPCVVPGDAATIPHHIISTNATARRTAAALAMDRGATALQVSEALHGDVAQCAERIGLALRTFASKARSGQTGMQSRLICWGGEPTVALPGPSAPPGGRMQALALLLARQLHEAGADADGITVLCAGTDGRDGATDAAGAIVQRHTWEAIRAAGRSPEHDLEHFESHAALQAAKATLPAYASGTNVNDLVLALMA